MANRVQKSPLRRGVLPKDRSLAIVQEDVDKGFREILKNTPFSNGTFLRDSDNKADPTSIVFSGSSIELAHRLDGAVKGFIVVDQNATVSFARLAPASGRESTHIKIGVSAPGVTAKFWVWR